MRPWHFYPQPRVALPLAVTSHEVAYKPPTSPGSAINTTGAGFDFSPHSLAMAYRHRELAAPLLGVNLVLYLILLGLASWALDEMLDGELRGGNQATGELIRFSLIAGVVGLASVFAGLLQVRHHRSEGHSGNGAAALIALLLTLLAFGLACKQINVGFVHSDRLKALEAFAIVTSATQLVYVLLVYFGDA